MKKIGNFELDKVYCGDCKKEMKYIPSNSIDLIVTDPPYQLSSTSRARPDQTKEGSYGKEVPFSRQQSRIKKGFMGKEWDVLPPIEVWKESLRILKPGAFAFIMTTPRQDSLCQILMDLTNAGFNMGFSSIYWTYASGFPKASNIGKMVDKRNYRTQETYKPFADYLKQKRLEKGLSMSRIDKLLGTNTAYSWWEGRISGIQLPSKIYYLKLKTILDLDNRFDELIEREEAKREIVGEKIAPNGKPYSARQPKQWTPQFSDYKVKNAKSPMITKPSTPQAKSLNGSYAGFQPKPAVEVIIVAMKPLSEKTYVDQALKNRKGITWLDNGRIPYESEEDKKSTIPFGDISKNKLYGRTSYLESKTINKFIKPPTKGRFPANLIVSDDVLNDGRNHIGWTGQKHKTEFNPYGGSSYHKSSTKRKGEFKGYDKSGSFSRYFDLDKWWKKKVKELDKYFSKAYNKEENKKGDMQWEVKQAEESRGLAKSGLPVNGAENNSKITQATKRDKNTIFVQKVAMPILDLQDLNQDVEFVEKKSNCTETDFVQKFVQIKQDTETLIEILNIEIKDNEIFTQQKRHLKSNLTDVKNAIQKLQLLRDTIQICQDQLKLYGYVNPAIIEPMLLDLNQDLLLKNLNLEILPSNVKRTFPFIVCAKASKSEKNRGLESFNDKQIANPFYENLPDLRMNHKQNRIPNKNTHPTVKPIKLMSYLITLGSRKGDIILDNFCGSGSTLVSAKMLNRRFIGFDTEMEYVKISRARLSAVKQIQERLL